MTYDWVLPLLAAALSLALGIVAFRAAPRAETNKVFAFLAAMLVFWNLNFFVLNFVSDHDTAFQLTRFLRPGAIFLLPAVLHLFATLTARNTPVWKAILIVDYAVAFMLVVANAFDAVVYDIREAPWGYTSVGSWLYDVYTVLVLINFGSALGLLIFEYKRCQNPRTRLQLRFWLLGAAVAIPLGLTTLFPVYGVPIYPLGNLGNVAWAAIVAYAIVRHRVMDVHVVISKGAAYAAVSAMLIAPLFVLSLLLQRYSYGDVHPDFATALLAMLVSIALLFPALLQRIEPRIQRSWLGERREYRTLLLEFARHVVRILERKRLLQELANALQNTLGLDRVAIALESEDRDAVSVVHHLGVPPEIASVPAKHPLLTWLKRRSQAISRDELAIRSNEPEAVVILQVFESNGWDLCVPLPSSTVPGFLALGPKPNVEAFFAEDLELLETLAAEASVALENARLYEELKKSQDIIRRADRSSALGTLAAGIAHEIRNPLVSIQTFFQLAPQRLGDSEFMTEFLEMTANEVKRISRLINELLSFARSPTPSYGAVDLNQLVERVVLLISPEARKHRIQLEQSLEADTPLVYGDAEQIRQVLINLAFNAFQATAENGRVCISTRPAYRNGTLFGRLEIKDTGEGIPASQLDNIFDPFYTTKVKGTGLGLAIVQRIISEHGGLVAVESTAGVGTSFTVDLITTASARTDTAENENQAEWQGEYRRNPST